MYSMYLKKIQMLTLHFFIDVVLYCPYSTRKFVPVVYTAVPVYRYSQSAVQLDESFHLSPISRPQATRLTLKDETERSQR